MSCEEKHGKIYPFNTFPYLPQHVRCRCFITPMRTKIVGTATIDGWNGVDAWIMYQKSLPPNYVTKDEAKKLGWVPKKHNLSEILPGYVIGGDEYHNYEEKLPTKTGRVWFKTDFDYSFDARNPNRILYSNDGLIFVSYDHAQTFYEIIK